MYASDLFSKFSSFKFKSISVVLNPVQISADSGIEPIQCAALTVYPSRHHTILEISGDRVRASFWAH